MKTRIKELEVLEYVSSWCVVTNWHFNTGWLLREPKINETLNNTGPHVPRIHISTDKMCSFTSTLSILVFDCNSIKKKVFLYDNVEPCVPTLHWHQASVPLSLSPSVCTHRLPSSSFLSKALSVQLTFLPFTHMLEVVSSQLLIRVRE